MNPGTTRAAIRGRVFKGENHYIAECLDVPVVTQGKTIEELKANLAEALALHLESENPSPLPATP